MKKRNYLHVFGVAYLFLVGLIALTGCPSNTPTGAGTPTPTPPSGLNVVGGVTVGSSTSGDQSAAANNYSSGICGYGGLAGENAYRFDVSSAPQTVSFKTCSSAPGTTIEPVLYILDATNVEKACTLDNCGTSTLQANLQYVFTTAGRYYIVVDGANGSAGPYVLDVTSP